MAPPAKRRRRNTAAPSDDDEEQPRANTLSNFLLSSPSSPTKTRIPSASPSPFKSKAVNRQSNSNGSTRVTRKTQPLNNANNPSPQKSKERGLSDEKGKSGDLKLLFSKQAQRAANLGCSSRDTKTTLIDDILSDPISEDDEISEMKVSSSSLVGQHAKKRLRHGLQTGSAESSGGCQRFLKPPKLASSLADDDSRPWSERFGPRNLDELAVHKKKVADVRRWLEDVMNGRIRQRLLILRGAAGSGKTTTLRILANDMGCEMLDWKNPTGNTGTGFVSASAQFQEFLGRGGKFGTLDVDSSETSLPPSYNVVPNHSTKRIIVIEEFPNTFSRSSTALTSFRSAITQYLTTHTPSVSLFSQQTPREFIMPVVMVISETLLTTTSASADSLTAHRLLGPEILSHPGVGVIEFNAIAPSLLAKALELVVQKESRKSGRRRTPGPLVLKRLGEIGDIRNALSSLEFLCLKGDHDSDWGSKVTFTKQKKGTKDEIGLTRAESDSLELISQREASLGIFHAVGKVVYNKRDDAYVKDSSEDLPSYLAHLSRPKRSQVSVEALIDETGTDTHTFISALHENYILSCGSSDPMDLYTSIDYVNDCIEHLSLSDLLSRSADVFFGGRSGFSDRDSGSHVLRQEEIAFQVAVRGMLFCLPHPVKRKTASTSKNSDAFKMFYPASLKLWRAKEEIAGLVDLWSSKVLKGEADVPTRNLTAGASAFRRQAFLGKSSQQQPDSKLTANFEGTGKNSQQSSALLSLGSAARRELIIERLPYMTHIARARNTGSRLRDLEKIVAFQGILSTNEDSDGEEDVVTGEAWATDKPTEEVSPRKKKTGIRSGAVTSLLAQKLVLSDDDIED